jgi:hypothetical protein
MGKISEYPIQPGPTGNDILLGTKNLDDEKETVNYLIGDILENYRIPTLNAPTIPTEACDVGEIGLDSGYIYFATGAGAWRRAPINSWPTGFAYTVTGLTGSRTLDLSTTYTIDDVVAVLGQLITDLKSLKVLE